MRARAEPRHEQTTEAQPGEQQQDGGAEAVTTGLSEASRNAPSFTQNAETPRIP